MKSKISITTAPGHEPTYKGPLDFAFVGHPRDIPDILRTYPHLEGRPAAEITANAYDYPVHVLGPIHVSLGGRELRGEVISIPYVAADFRRNIRSVQKSVFDTLNYCADRGAKIIGLGALLPSVSRHGRTLTDQCPSGIGITTGHSYTAHAIAEHVRKIELYRGRPQTVAIVGAAGSTGRAAIDCLLSDKTHREMILLDLPIRIAGLDQFISETNITYTSDFADLRKAQIIVCVTNATHSIIQSEHLSSHCIVIDDAYPPNISLDAVRNRPDIIVLKCLSHVPQLKCPFDFGLFAPDIRLHKQHIVFTCLAEIVLLAASNQDGHFTIGSPTTQQLRHIAKLATQFGVDIAPFHSFLEIGEIDASRLCKGEE